MSADGVETHTSGIKFDFLSDIKDKAEHPKKKLLFLIQRYFVGIKWSVG